MKLTPTRCVALPTILALLILTGCQGISTGSSGNPTPGQVSASLATLSFGSVKVNTTSTKSETITNVGGSSVTITQAPVVGSTFSITGLSLPLTLAAGKSTSFNVVFSPKSAGAASGTVSIASDAWNPNMSVELAGTGTVDPVGQLSVAPTTLNAGSIVVGSSGTVSGTLNATGASVTVNAASSSNGRFTLSGLSLPVTIAAGQSKAFTVTFSPQSAGAANATLTFTSDASPSTTTATVTGTGLSAPGQLSVTPTTLNVGNVTVGNSGTATGTLDATGASVTVTAASSNNARFAISGLSLPVTIAAGQSASFTVTFSPQSAGAASSTLTFTSNATPATTTATVNGTGVSAPGQLSVNPTTINVGSVTVGSSGTATGTLNATGASVTVTAASSNNARFTISGLSLPVTIGAGQSASFTVTFSPQSAGAASGTLTFTSNASPSTTTATMTGTGVVAVTHTVDLVWQASSSSDVVGYNVYRAPLVASCGSYSKLNSTLDSFTAYTDSLVTNGSKYCYATTAVDSSSKESSFSNTVQVTIP